MSQPIGPVPGGGAARSTRDAETLRKASHDLEGVFVNELFKAMRETVPQDGIFSSDPGRDLFAGMLDERLAALYGQRAQGGIGEALYRQLSRRLPVTDTGPGAP
jgi:flagellar protein FlgJ